MASVYIVYSPSIDSYYVGSCLDISERLLAHNTNKYDSAYTRRATDWDIYFLKEHLEYDVARKIESHIKRMKSRVYIWNLNKYPEMIEKLVFKYK